MHKPIYHFIRSVFAVLIVVIWSSVVGCEMTQTRQATEKEAPIRPDDVKVTTEQFRLRIRSLVGPMCGQIEQAADAIIATAPDPKVKLAALQWKMDAVPAMREAIFRPDAYSAAFDTAALCMQMIDYFEHGPGIDALGPTASAQAAAACRSMLDQYLKVVASATSSGDISTARDFVQRWAAQHPIRHSISDRESAMSRVFEQEFFDPRSAMEYVADAAATADDLTRKMDVYSDQLFRQARWEVERLQLEMVRDYRIDQLMPLTERAVKSAEQAGKSVDHLSPAVERTLGVAAEAGKTVDRLAPAVERTLTVTENVPKMLASEREIALKAVHDEITRSLQVVREERAIAFQQISKERGTASMEIRDALSAQATQLAGDAEKMVTRQIDYVIDKSTRLVQIAMAVAIAVVFLVMLFRRRIGRRPN